MANKSRIALLISLLTTLVALLLIYLKVITSFVGYSIIIGIAVSTMNFLLFICAYVYSIKKSNNTFLIFTLGGIGIRILIVLLMVFISIKFLKVDKSGFIFALFLWYVFYLMYEISIVRLKLEQH